MEDLDAWIVIFLNTDTPKDLTLKEILDKVVSVNPGFEKSSFRLMFSESLNCYTDIIDFPPPFFFYFIIYLLLVCTKIQQFTFVPFGSGLNSVLKFSIKL